MIRLTPLRDAFRPAVGILAAGLVAASLAGCGSSSHAGGSTTTAAADTAAAGASAGSPSQTASVQGSTTDGAGHPIDVCSVLPASSAASLSGEGITTADTQTQLLPKEYGCAYGNADDSLQVEVTVFEHNAAFTYNTFASGSKGTSTVTGLGDKAFFDNHQTMYVLKGSNLIQVNGLTTADKCAALARPVLAAL